MADRTALFVHGTPIQSVFELLGTKENDLTYSTAWALSCCGPFLEDFVSHLCGQAVNVSDASIRLQEHGKDQGGFTDIEVIVPSKVHLVVEAKRGWNLPNMDQLNGYTSESSFVQSRSAHRELVVLTECSEFFAKANLPSVTSNGFPIVAMSWDKTMRVAAGALDRCSHAQKRMLNELLVYLGGLIPVQSITSNR